MTQANPLTTNRRQFLAGAAGLGAAATGVVSVAVLAQSPMPAMARDWFTLGAQLSNLDDLVERTDANALHFEEIDRQLEDLCDRRNEIESDLCDAVAATHADAIAHLEVARDDMVRFKFGGVAFSDDGDGGDRLALSAIDNALRVLRSI